MVEESTMYKYTIAKIATSARIAIIENQNLKRLSREFTQIDANERAKGSWLNQRQQRSRGKNSLAANTEVQKIANAWAVKLSPTA